MRNVQLEHLEAVPSAISVATQSDAFMTAAVRLAKPLHELRGSPLGQVRDSIGFFGEDRIWILKPPRLAWLREKAAAAGIDPLRP